MTPAPDTEFLLHIDTNEMIERERFTALLAAIEEALRRYPAGGRQAYLLVGGVRYGSVDTALAVGGLILAVPGFIVALKQLAGDRKPEPNGFAVALADVMAFDGASQASFVHKDKTVTVHKSEVPFVQKIAFGYPVRGDRQQAIRPEELQADEAEEPISSVEDEDQDWVPTLEAGDHPPREARASPSGYFNFLTMIGQFERASATGGGSELRFVPRDPTFATSFVVTSNAYDTAPDEYTDYEVTGNITVDGDEAATIEILAIHPPQDDFLTLKT